MFFRAKSKTPAARRTRNTLSRHRSLFETLESRNLLAVYGWNDSTNSIGISLGLNESITVSEASGIVTLKLSGGTFSQISGSDTAPGNNTNTLSMNASDISQFLKIDNNHASVTSGTNNVTFSGNGSFSAVDILVEITDPNATGTVSTTSGFDLTVSSSLLVYTNRNISLGLGTTITANGSGAILLAANQQVTPTAGNFIGIYLNGAVIATNGTGNISLEGRGGNTGELNTGVYVVNAAKILSNGPSSTGNITINGTGGAGSNANKGVVINTNAQVSSATGAIEINGQSSGIGNANHGITIESGAHIESTGAGANAATISIQGTGGSGVSSNIGVFISDPNTLITSLDGDIHITGNGGNGSSLGNTGVALAGPAMITSTGTGANAAAIHILGDSGAGATPSGSTAVAIYGSNPRISSADGDINITGNSAGAVFNLSISLVTSNAVVSTGKADVTLIGDSMSIAEDNAINATTSTVKLLQRVAGGAINIGPTLDAGTAALQLSDGELDNIVAGTIQIGDETTGTITVSSAIQHLGDANFEVTTGRNIVINSGSHWTTTNGDLTFSANQQTTPTSGNFVGIDVNAATIMTNGTGDILVQGRGGNTLGSNYGIYLSSVASILSASSSADAGTITVNGTGGAGTLNNHGVFLTSSTIESFNGDIEITGNVSTGSDDSSHGIYLGGALIISKGEGVDAAKITIDGKGGPGADSNYGVYIRDFVVSSIDGDIQITGQSAGSASDNYGVFLDSSATVISTGEGLNAAKITIDGKGGAGTQSNHGVYLTDLSLITSVDGNIEITGAAGNDGAFGIRLANIYSAVQSAGEADVTFITDSLDIAAGAIAGVPSITAGTSRVTIKTKTTDGSIGIDIGGNDTATTLGLSDAELDRIAAGTIIIGDAATPNTIVVAGSIQHAGDADFEVITARNIATLGIEWKTVNGDLSFVANQQLLPTLGNFIGIDIPGKLFTVGSGNISLKGNGGSTGNDNIGIRLSGDSAIKSTSALTGAGSITLEGTSSSGLVGGNNSGIYITGVNSIITSVVGSIRIVGQGGAGSTSQNHGVYIERATVSSTGTDSGAATITINGTAGEGLSNNLGVHITTSALVTSAYGSIDIIGHGHGIEDSNHGVTIVVSTVSSTGTGISAAAIRIEGTGGNGRNDNTGVYLISTPSTGIRSYDGVITIVGFGGAGTGTGNHGVKITGHISAAESGANFPAISIAGTGGGTGLDSTNNDGVLIRESTSFIISGTGDIEIIGTAGIGTGSSAIELFQAEIQSIGTGNVILIGDSINLLAHSLINAGTNTVTIHQKTNGVNINLGDPDASGFLDIYVNNITAGTIEIGDGNTGDIYVTSPVTFSAATNVVLTGERVLAIQDGTDFNLAGGTLSFGAETVLYLGLQSASDYDQLIVNGTVNIAGVKLEQGLGFVPSQGTTLKIIDATVLVGTFSNYAQGDVVASPLKINYDTVNGNVLLSVPAPPTPLDVTVVFVGGNLTITGSDISNHILITEGTAYRQVIVRGLFNADRGEYSLINGLSEAVFNRVTGTITVNMNGGNDEVEVRRIIHNNDFTINAGSGADKITLGKKFSVNTSDTSVYTRITGALTINGERGEDKILLGRVYGDGIQRIDGGADNDTIEAFVVYAGAVSYSGGTGNDNIQLGYLNAKQTWIVHGNGGDDTINVANSKATLSANFYGDTGNDTISLDANTFSGILNVYGGIGNDSVLIGRSTMARDAKFDLADGNDTIHFGRRFARNSAGELIIINSGNNAKKVTIIAGAGTDTVISANNVLEQYFVDLGADVDSLQSTNDAVSLLIDWNGGDQFDSNRIIGGTTPQNGRNVRNFEKTL